MVALVTSPALAPPAPLSWRGAGAGGARAGAGAGAGRGARGGGARDAVRVVRGARGGARCA